MQKKYELSDFMREKMIKSQQANKDHEAPHEVIKVEDSQPLEVAGPGEDIAQSYQYLPEEIGQYTCVFATQTHGYLFDFSSSLMVTTTVKGDRREDIPKLCFRIESLIVNPDPRDDERNYVVKTEAYTWPYNVQYSTGEDTVKLLFDARTMMTRMEYDFSSAGWLLKKPLSTMANTVQSTLINGQQDLKAQTAELFVREYHDDESIVRRCFSTQGLFAVNKQSIMGSDIHGKIVGGHQDSVDVKELIATWKNPN